MSRKYKFSDQSKLYFVTLTVVSWIDVFIQKKYKDIILESWKYCIQYKGLEIYAWVIMTNHIHMIIGSNKDKLEDIMRDMKRHTSKKILKELEMSSEENKKVLSVFEFAGNSNPNNKKYQFWQQHNHPIVLDNNFLQDQKLEYIHQNPVKKGLAETPEEYEYSSAINYTGGNGLIDVILIE